MSDKIYNSPKTTSVYEEEALFTFLSKFGFSKGATLRLGALCIWTTYIEGGLISKEDVEEFGFLFCRDKSYYMDRAKINNTACDIGSSYQKRIDSDEFLSEEKKFRLYLNTEIRSHLSEEDLLEAIRIVSDDDEQDNHQSVIQALFTKAGQSHTKIKTDGYTQIINWLIDIGRGTE